MMHMRDARRLLILGSIILLTSVSGLAKSGTIDQLEDCQLIGVNALSFAKAKCTEIEVPENPEQADGNKITLKVALVPALTKNDATVPLLIITGGPGSSALENYPSIKDSFRYVREQHDILLIDQRGTGGSAPFNCPTDKRFDDPGVVWTPELVKEINRECLSNAEITTRFVTTSVAVRDIEQVRRHFAYPQLNIYGISYGTRVAQHYLRRYPDRTRAVILDGVAPPGWILGLDMPVDTQRALELMFSRCENSPECHGRFPELVDHFQAVRERLESGPIPVTLSDPLTGDPIETQFTELEFTLLIRLMSYSPPSVSIMPIMIEQAFQTGDYGPLKAYSVRVLRDLSDIIYDGMEKSVICTEDMPFIDRNKLDRQRLSATFLGTVQLDLLLETCQAWPKGVMDADFHEPVVSSKPVLILSGSADPVTPPANGKRILRTLSNARHIVGEGMGHGIYGTGCMPRLMKEFIESASAFELDSSCLTIQQPDPFFMNSVGPAP